jgi:hypothetical protein
VTYLTYSHGKGSGECAIMPAFAHPLAWTTLPLNFPDHTRKFDTSWLS